MRDKHPRCSTLAFNDMGEKEMRIVAAAIVLLLVSTPASASTVCKSLFANDPQVRQAITRENSPASTVANETYLVGPQPTGAFSGHANDWAVFDGFIWTFEDAIDCDIAVVIVDHIRTTINGGFIYESTLIFDDTTNDWSVLYSGYQRQDTPINANTTITIGQLEIVQPVRVWKNDTNAYTYTLPGGAPDNLGPARVIVENVGTSGDITVNVSLSGTIDGNSSATVAPGTAKTFTYVWNDNGTPIWMSL